MVDLANLEILQSALVRVAVVTLMVSIGLRVQPATILESRRQRFAITTTLVLAFCSCRRSGAPVVYAAATDEAPGRAPWSGGK